MSNVNIGQLRSILAPIPASQLVVIQAGTVLALLNLVKGLQGSEAVVTMVGIPSPNAPVDLSRF